jgi:hypothetical protein
MRLILGKWCEQNKEVPHIFIRFQTAYDTVWRKEIWSEMQKQGFPQKIVNLCRIKKNKIYAKVKIGKYLSS